MEVDNVILIYRDPCCLSGNSAVVVTNAKWRKIASQAETCRESCHKAFWLFSLVVQAVC